MVAPGKGLHEMIGVKQNETSYYCNVLSTKAEF